MAYMTAPGHVRVIDEDLAEVALIVEPACAWRDFGGGALLWACGAAPGYPFGFSRVDELAGGRTVLGPPRLPAGGHGEEPIWGQIGRRWLTVYYGDDYQVYVHRTSGRLRPADGRARARPRPRPREHRSRPDDCGRLRAVVLVEGVRHLDRRALAPPLVRRGHRAALSPADVLSRLPARASDPVVGAGFVAWTEGLSHTRRTVYVRLADRGRTWRWRFRRRARNPSCRRRTAAVRRHGRDAQDGPAAGRPRPALTNAQRVARRTTRERSPARTVTFARRLAAAASARRPLFVARSELQIRAALTSPRSVTLVRCQLREPARRAAASLRARQRSEARSAVRPISVTERPTPEQPVRAPMRSASWAATARSAKRPDRRGVLRRGRRRRRCRARRSSMDRRGCRPRGSRPASSAGRRGSARRAAAETMSSSPSRTSSTSAWIFGASETRFQGASASSVAPNRRVIWLRDELQAGVEAGGGLRV